MTSNPREIARAVQSILDHAASTSLAPDAPSPNTAGMSDEMNRHEVTARLEASEARVALAVEGMRSDMAQLRSDMSVHAERSEAKAETFYAEAGKVLAEIRAANAEHKASLYGVGYKVIAWTLGTILAVSGVAVGVYRAALATAGG